MTARIYDPGIPSDGLTIDSGRGPIDLVVIDRALRGLPVQLSGAETTHLAELVPIGDRSVAQRVADATGVTLEAVPRRAARARTRQHI